ncbi:MAG TPA: polyamine aminopropyltransferase [Candidatus Acetothermia bacterium]|nr:polyamine aminopropyltransferase [Candidatus Acetothermia bacterium]
MSADGRREDWLCERQTEGVSLCLRVRRWLVRRRTPFQELVLAETEELGLVLALDGKIMLSQRDEPFYHEMLVHPAMLLHPSPQRVLVVGGGDGGTLREVLHHPPVQAVTLVEIDREVIQASRELLRPIHQGAWDDPRVEVVIAPGEEYVAGMKGAFDVILVDSTDPIGPGEALFSDQFFAACREALAEGGLLALQAGTPFFWQESLSRVVNRLRRHFPEVAVYLGFVPSYPSGMWAYALAGPLGFRDQETELETRFADRQLSTHYYTPAVHRAAFTLPPFLSRLLAEKTTPTSPR